MIFLPNDCTMSKPSVNPKNWETCPVSALKKPWRIQYYFRDPKQRKRYPYGKLIAIKGMNVYKTLEERREAVRTIIEDEIYTLKILGYNPITKKYFNRKADPLTLSSRIPLGPCIEAGFRRIEAHPKTIQDLKNVKDHFLETLRELRFYDILIIDIKRAHIRTALEHLADSRGYSNKRYNKARSYMSMIFKELVSRDILEVNPIQAIPKKKTVKRLREVLTKDDLDKVKDHLSENYPAFYRFVVIFYYSGSRTSELLSLRVKDVNIDEREFKITVKKGRRYTEEIRAINKSVLSLWRILIEGADPEEFVFSKGLKPGDKSIDPWQISKRWRIHVKDKLGITADLYSLKHLFLTRIVEAHNRDLAQGIAGHKNKAMLDKHYDVLKQKRDLDSAKGLDIDF